MKKQILNLGKKISKLEQKNILGGDILPIYFCWDGNVCTMINKYCMEQQCQNKSDDEGSDPSTD